MAASPANVPSLEPATGQEPEVVEVYKEDKPTASHRLVDANQDEKGVAQLEHGDVEVKNLGWNEEARNVPRPLIGGLSNEELWTLIRRFNKQMFHVKSIPDAPVRIFLRKAWLKARAGC